MRRIALAALAAALEDGKPDEAPKRSGLKGVRALAAGAALYTAGRVAFSNRDAIRERLGDTDEEEDFDEDEEEFEEPEAEDDEDVDEDDAEAEDDEEFEEPEAEEDEDLDEEDVDDDEDPRPRPRRTRTSKSEDVEDDEPEAEAEDEDLDEEPTRRNPKPRWTSRMKTGRRSRRARARRSTGTVTRKSRTQSSRIPRADRGRPSGAPDRRQTKERDAWPSRTQHPAATWSDRGRAGWRTSSTSSSTRGW